MEPKYPSNSLKSREPQEERRKLQPVVTGEVTERKRMGRYIRESIISDDAKNVGQYIIQDALLPNILRFLEDMMNTAFTSIFGRNMARTVRTAVNDWKGAYRPYEKVSYNRASERRGDPRDRMEPGHTIAVPRGIDRVSDFTAETRGDAEAVIIDMNAAIEQEGYVTVEDLCDLCRMGPGEFTDAKWGWVDVITSRPFRLRDGRFALNLPKPVPLDMVRR